MTKYNLLPNHATISADCKLQQTKLASLYSNLILPFKEENIIRTTDPNS